MCHVVMCGQDCIFRLKKVYNFTIYLRLMYIFFIVLKTAKIIYDIRTLYHTR